tara:strand:+ start:100 stop:723 length:624 start_codon:yes stop_codon:yes gene_type:complete
MENSIEYKKLLNHSENLIDKWFDKGKGLRGYNLKNFTSGDGNNEGFEEITKNILKKAIEIFELENRTSINSDYIIDPKEEYDSQRMDNHVYIDGKLVLVEENRAWIDKPFYVLKRAVVQAFMELPHTKEKLSDDVEFLFSSLAKDVTDSTISTSEHLYGYGDKITEVNFSGHPRRSDKFNYFDNGYDKNELTKYIKTLCRVFSKYAK